MVFRRRDRRPLHRAVADFVWPRGGWARAFHYVKHRVRRLPDSPERIARGVWAGVFTTFTPFYAMHFVVAALIARLINGNILAALSGTFFGNPLTYVPIGVAALQTGHWMLGTEFDEDVDTSLIGKFIDAGKDLKDNLFALFRDQPADWDGLHLFYDEVFFPYLVGGVVPGVITATICYMISLPVIRAYQQHRRSRIKAKFEAIRKRAEMEAAGVQVITPELKAKPKLSLPRVRKVK
ncbi:hypothetical protein PH5382_00787 [Phaeobacter sp. CECT 5382]|uniref:DUF2062 domain-containing protein n=1 Tax=Phaeobacter sp. CECT 5382 TaxID=1712645 RepID=UPI0006DAFBD0|nr:DUF2062 domain-containing protein [Phaeobacter sp. CECT 5382]CUH86868.1 hypothetical protein PH5382_00787 [Phaeobacter sp. CECT 5382]